MLPIRSFRSFQSPARAVLRRTYASKVAAFNGQKDSNGLYAVSLIEGDGIGPEIAQSVKDIFAAAKAPVKWEPVDVTPILKDGKTTIASETIESINRNKVALKGPLAVSQILLEPWRDSNHAIDANWERSRLAESYPAPNIQPFRERSSMSIHRRLQDPIR